MHLQEIVSPKGLLKYILDYTIIMTNKQVKSKKIFQFFYFYSICRNLFVTVNKVLY